MLCPCNSNKNYQICCAPYHKGNLHAPTAVALMRSRYSAYVLNNLKYIYRTWDKNSRPPLKILQQDNSQQFTHLVILNTSKGNIEDNIGTVEFVASYIIDNKDQTFQHQENSYFEKHNNKWKYINELSKINNNGS